MPATTRSSARVEVGLAMSSAVRAGGEDRGLVADVGEVGAGQAGGLAREQREVDVGAERLVAACGPSGSPRGRRRRAGRRRSGGRSGPGAAARGSSLSSRFDAAITTTSSAEPKPSISTSSWLSVCSRSELLSEPRRAADRVDLVDEDDRRRVLARLGEQAPDARRAEAGEHLDERGGRLREEVRAGLVRDGLGQQRLAGAGRAVEQDALRHLGAELLEALRVAQELDDLLQLGLGLVGAGDVVPADRRLRRRA